MDELNEKHVLNPKRFDLGFFTKYDGLSVVLEIVDGKVKSAITRGDKELGTGQDKTGLFKYYDFSRACEILKTNKFGLKCEALVSKENFEEYNKKFGNGTLVDPRSAASSILNSDDPTIEELKYLTLMPLVISLSGVEYPLPDHTKKLPEELFSSMLDDSLDIVLKTNCDIPFIIERTKAIVKKMSEEIEDIALPADGIVIRIENPEYIQALGRDEVECINNFERAYKFPHLS